MRLIDDWAIQFFFPTIGNNAIYRPLTFATKFIVVESKDDIHQSTGQSKAELSLEEKSVKESIVFTLICIEKNIN